MVTEGPAAAPSRVVDYYQKLQAYNDLVKRVGASMPGATDAQVFARPEVKAAFNDISRLYSGYANPDGTVVPGLEGASSEGWAVGNTEAGPGNVYMRPEVERNAIIPGTRNDRVDAPQFWTGNGQGGFGKLLKMAIPAVASYFLTPAIGGPISSALGVSGAVGQGLAGAALGGITSKLTGGNPLLGAVTGGVGGYASGGGFDDLLGSTSLSTPSPGALTGGSVNADFAKGLGGAPSLSSGGTSGGFLNLGELSPSAGGLSGAVASLADDPLGYLGTQLTSGVTDMFDPKNLIKSGLKYGISSALQKDNAGGFNAVQNAANTAAGHFQPYYQAGTAAQGQLADALGLNGPAAAQAAVQGFQANPGYQFARDQGIKALDASAAKRGMLVSGNNQQAIQDYGTGLANQYFQQYLQNLAGTAAQGQNAAQQMGQNTVDAATAYAVMKANKANQFNQNVGGLLSGLFPSAQDKMLDAFSRLLAA